MTGHAFQVLTEDAQLRESLAAIQSALTHDGRFMFETRNPLARGWEAWVPENAVTIEVGGTKVTMSHQVDNTIAGGLVSFTATYSSPSWNSPIVSKSTLRFLDNESLSRFLSGAGLATIEQYGDWDCLPYTDSSPEIITIARRV